MPEITMIRLSGDEAQSLISGMFIRHRKILVVTYGFVGFALIAATLWYIVLIVMGRTAFPRWMAAINPLTGLAVWLVLKRLLPSRLAAAFEGAGFNIAYVCFFTATTLVLWEGI